MAGGWLRVADGKLIGMTDTPTAAPAVPVQLARRRLLLRSPAGQPAWARPALLGLAVVAGVVYAWGVRDGQLHPYYAPAVKSMSESWRAFFYGGYDPAASITLDKLPGAFMVEALSVRVFGFSTWSVLLPQVVETVVTVLVLYRVVRRWLGPGAGLLAAATFATTPIVAALAHAGISDTLLTLLLVLAADAWQRAVAGGRLGWLLLAGVWVGLAFHTKMVQAWGVLPALAVGYLVAAPGPLRRRLGHIGLAGVATLAVSMSWIVMVLLTPASSRPYVDGSLNNSPLSMVFEYNLLSRYGGGSDTTPGFGGRGAGGTLSFMFSDAVAPQVGWVYPLALLGLVTGVWWRSRAPRTDLVRVGFVMWGLWLAVHAAAFSTGRVAHTFYVAAVAPATAALAGGGLVVLWRAYRRGVARGRVVRGGVARWLPLPLAVAATVAWAGWLSNRFPTFLPWMTPLLVALGAVSVALLVAVGLARGTRRLRRHRFLTARMALAGVVTAVVAVLAAPAAWAASTVDSRYSGSAIGPSAGPVGEPGPGGPGGPVRYGPAYGGPRPPGPPLPGDGPFPGVRPGLRAGGGTGGVGGAERAAHAKQLVEWLRSHQPGSRYLLAVDGSGAAGQYILAGASVLPMGGFSGQVPFPTIEQLAQLVATGEVRYVLLGSGALGVPAGDVGWSWRRSAWVLANCAAVSDSTLDVPGLHDCARS